VIKPHSLLILGTLVVSPVLKTQAEGLQNLIDRSPFSPAAGQNPTEVATTNSVLEFRGMVSDAEGSSFSVFDTTANKARWLRVGEGDSFKVKQFDAANNQLEVEQNGKSLKLPLKHVTIAAGPAIVAQPRQAPQNGGGGPPQANPGSDPAGDANRLQTVAAEVRRRRAMRNTAPPANAAPAPAPAKK
jgi:hypothetical protein